MRFQVKNYLAFCQSESHVLFQSISSRKRLVGEEQREREREERERKTESLFANFFPGKIGPQNLAGFGLRPLHRPQSGAELDSAKFIWAEQNHKTSLASAFGR